MYTTKETANPIYDQEFEDSVFGYGDRINLMSKDPDLVIFRRFRRLMMYKLVHQQNRLTYLEGKIDDYERLKDRPCDKPLHGGMNLLMSELENVLNDYNMSLFLLSVNRNTLSPSSDLLASLEVWLKEAIKHSFDFIKNHECEELVAPLSNPKGLIHKFIDKTTLNRLFFIDEEKLSGRGTTSTPGIKIYSEDLVRQLENILINLSFCVLILLPVGVLPRIKNFNFQILVISGAVLLTTFIASTLSDRTQRSGLAVMAAYTAVLVVFLGNTL